MARMSDRRRRSVGMAISPTLLCSSAFGNFQAICLVLPPLRTAGAPRQSIRKRSTAHHVSGGRRQSEAVERRKLAGSDGAANRGGGCPWLSFVQVTEALAPGGPRARLLDDLGGDGFHLRDAEAEQ